MKNVGADYINALKNPVQRRVKLFTLTLVNGAVYYLTNASEHIKYGGHKFISSPGVTLSAVRNSTDASKQTATATIIFDPAGLKLDTVKRGGLENATFEAVQVHSDNLAAGSMFLFGGYVDDIEHGELSVNVNLVGYSARAGGATIGEVYSERCRNVFGDRRCKYPVDTLAQHFSIINLGSTSQAFYAGGLTQVPEGYWNFGTVKFTKGDNAGRVYDMTVINAQVVITNPLAYPLAIGDEGELRPGCSKYRVECVNRWDNLLNMNAEPDVPNLTAGLDDAPQDQPPVNTYTKDEDGNLIYFRPGGITPPKYDPGQWPATNDADNPPMYSS